MRSLGCVLALAAACGSVNKLNKQDAPPPPDVAIDAPPPDPLDGVKSGSRLKVQWFVFDDGTKSLTYLIHDTQLGADCSPGSYMGDTTTYCIPQAYGVYYSDATCQTKIALVYTNPCPSPQAPIKFAAEYMQSSCGGGLAHLYPLGMQTTAATYYYKDSAGNCQTGGSTSSETVYALGSEVQTSQLATLTPSAPTSGTVGVVNFTSADGLVFPDDLHDSTNNVDCYANYYYPGAKTATCVPADAAYGGYFNDAACTVNEAYRATGCTVPPLAVVPSRTGCPLDPLSVKTVGSAFATQGQPYTWNATTQTCSASNIGNSYTFYMLGNDVPLQTVDRVVDSVPGHRLQPIHFSTGTARQLDYSLYDTTLATECYPDTFSNGSTYCFPNEYSVQSLYTDASCTTPVDLALVYHGWPSSCASPPLYNYGAKYVSGTNQCNGSYELHPIGSKFTGTVYELSGSTCIVYPQSAQYDFYQVGPVVPIVGLPTATIQNDP